MIEMGNIWETMIIREHIGKVVPPRYVRWFLNLMNYIYQTVRYMCSINPRNWSYWHQLGDFFLAHLKKGGYHQL